MQSDILPPQMAPICEPNSAAPAWPGRDIASSTQAPSFVAACEISFDPSPTVSLVVRLICGNVCAAERVVWRATFAKRADATLQHEWLTEQPERLGYWASYAELFGSESLHALFEPDLTFETSAPGDDRETAQAIPNTVSYEPVPICSSLLRRNGKFGISLQHGSEGHAFWSVMFREEWERERFLDWWRHQSDRFADFAKFLEQSSSVELERLVLREMLETERGVRKAGLSSGGRRPLRFWRGDR